MDALIDDFADPARASNGAQWALVSDGVMGGLSSGRLTRETLDGRNALRMRGQVRLENNGGFLQMAIDLAPGGAPVDASRFAGIGLTVRGNGERFGVHLRSADVTRPWQSYRASFVAPSQWTDVTLRFEDFSPHRIDTPLDTSRLRRIGLVAIGRAFEADLAVSDVRFVLP